MSRIEHVLREIQQMIEFYDKIKDLREKISEKAQKKKKRAIAVKPNSFN